MAERVHGHGRGRRDPACCCRTCLWVNTATHALREWLRGARAGCARGTVLSAARSYPVATAHHSRTHRDSRAHELTAPRAGRPARAPSLWQWWGWHRVRWRPAPAHRSAFASDRDAGTGRSSCAGAEGAACCAARTHGLALTAGLDTPAGRLWACSRERPGRRVSHSGWPAQARACCVYFYRPAVSHGFAPAGPRGQPQHRRRARFSLAVRGAQGQCSCERDAMLLPRATCGPRRPAPTAPSTMASAP